MITSRPLPDAEMSELRLASVDVFEMQPFDRGDLDTFALRWFRARNPEDLQLASELAVRFVARVAGARLGPVARVPLLATIAALVFERDNGGPLPSSRAALYERFVDHLLSGRRELRHLHDAIDTALSNRGGAPVGRLAAWLRDDFPTVINGALEAVGVVQIRDPQADLVDVVAAWLRQRSDNDLLAILPNGRQLLRDLLLATGMLVPRGGRLRFTHQSFAEFFAARHGASSFEPTAWRELMANPAARSLAAFMVAPRPDSDRLVAGLLDGSFDAVAAGDLLADGIPVQAGTRQRVIDSLIAEVSADTTNSGESLRVLRELSVDTDVLRRLTDLAMDNAVNEWTRLVVADAVADVDRAAGVRLLRRAARTDDPVARAWAAERLSARGAAQGPVEWEAPRGGARHPLGVLGRQALADRAGDTEINDDDRIKAAIRLAHDGELGALRGLLESPGIHDTGRLRAADALCAHGDDTALLALAGGSTTSGYYVTDSATNHSLRYGALVVLHRLGHRAAARVCLRRLWTARRRRARTVPPRCWRNWVSSTPCSMWPPGGASRTRRGSREAPGGRSRPSRPCNAPVSRSPNHEHARGC